MKNNFKVTIPLAILITLLSVIYQRATGPTYPKKMILGLTEETSTKVKLPRSHGGTSNAPIVLPKIEKNMSASVTYKRYPTNDEWRTENLLDDGNNLTFGLPNQPPAGKIAYFINVAFDGKNQSLASKEEPIIIRYKGDVPSHILIPHIILMFIAMLFSTLAALEALYRTQSYEKIAQMTLAFLTLGGGILGPMVQKYAFGVYWAGFPFDWDLTDNKLLIGVIGWTFGVLLTYKLKKRWPVIVAGLILIGVYSIPHSMRGSQFNYEKGEVQTVRH